MTTDNLLALIVRAPVPPGPLSFWVKVKYGVAKLFQGLDSWNPDVIMIVNPCPPGTQLSPTPGWLWQQVY